MRPSFLSNLLLLIFVTHFLLLISYCQACKVYHCAYKNNYFTPAFYKCYFKKEPCYLYNQIHRNLL